MCLIILSNEDAKIGQLSHQGNKKPHLLGKQVGKNNIKIMKKIQLYFFSMPLYQKTDAKIGIIF